MNNQVLVAERKSRKLQNTKNFPRKLGPVRALKRHRARWKEGWGEQERILKTSISSSSKVRPTPTHYRVNSILKVPWSRKTGRKRDLTQLDYPINDISPWSSFSIIFHSLQITNSLWLQTHLPMELTTPLFFPPFLLSPTGLRMSKRNTSATATTHLLLGSSNKGCPSICWESWLSYTQRQSSHWFQPSINVFSGHKELSFCLFLSISSFLETFLSLL